MCHGSFKFLLPEKSIKTYELYAKFMDFTFLPNGKSYQLAMQLISIILFDHIQWIIVVSFLRLISMNVVIFNINYIYSSQVVVTFGIFYLIVYLKHVF